MIFQNNLNRNLLLFLILLFGAIISYHRGSNFSDGDSYSVILAFLNFIDNGIYTPSRGAYGHPIPEFIIGLTSYYLGTSYSNILCFTFLFFALIFLYKTFLNNTKSLFLFVLLVLSNSYVFLENTNSIDYPIAIFFFSVGLFLFKEKRYILSYFFLGFSIASRANFLTFVYPLLFIYYIDLLNNKSIKKIFISFLIVSLSGLIFYLPLFKLHDFSLAFLEIPFLMEKNNSDGWYGGPKLEFKSLFPRFIYKVYLLTGIFSSIYILFYIKGILKYLMNNFKENLIFLSIIFINIFIFFFMPTKILIINPFIIFFYIILFKYFDLKKIYILILFNFIQWIAIYDFANITYKTQNICFAKEAIKYEFTFSLKKGVFVEYFLNEKDMSVCYSQFMGKYSENFKKGKPLRLSK